MMNGAITVATLDGANVEIRDEVGDENIVIFGMTEREVIDYYRHGGYSAIEMYNNDPRIKNAVDQLVNGFFPVSNVEFMGIYNHLLLQNDEYFVLKDFNAYVEAHKWVDELYRQKSRWAKMSISNIAHSGVFSSDRTISEYATGIWGVKEVII
jgi:glycogen phosphorylase